MEKLDGKAAVVSGGEEKSAAMMHSTYNAPTPTVALPPALANMNNNVLDDAILKKLVDPDIYYAFARCRATGLPMDKADANALAESIREWAQSKGCIGYSHWFSPMRGPIHGEKLETFVAVDFATDRLIINLTGSDLFQTETDGSSFPNGGLRETYKAAAYIGWDTGSPPFVYRETLYIPSAFVSWTGEALDQKTPLLRADLAVDEQSLRLLAHLGDTDTKQVVCNVGWEQEFFLIDREKYLARPDLVATGRTLLGASPLRGQELSTNYFARLSPRVNRYMAAAREKMWELGISIHCTHNEVAPAQHEISPIFNLANLAADTNVLAMDVLRGPGVRPRFRHPLPRKAFCRHQRKRQAQQLGPEHRHWCQPVRAGGNRKRQPSLHRVRRGSAAWGEQARRLAALRGVDRRQRPPPGGAGGAAGDYHAPPWRAPGSAREEGRRGRQIHRIRNAA